MRTRTDPGSAPPRLTGRQKARSTSQSANASLRKNMITFSKLPSTTIFWHIKEWRLSAMVHKQMAAGMDPDPEQIAELAAEWSKD